MSGDVMMFPDTVEEFMEQYKVVDREQVYSNGIEFVPIFRMQQWFDHVKHSPDDVRPVGKWVKNHDEVMWWWECSNCKEKPLISRFGDAEVLSAYCPRCGVKLEIPEGE